MELTESILLKNGFENNHAERVLPTYYCHGVNPEYRIQVSTTYQPITNKIGYSINCTKLNDSGIVSKRSSVGITDTVEDLQRCIDLCDINKEIIC